MRHAMEDHSVHAFVHKELILLKETRKETKADSDQKALESVCRRIMITKDSSAHTTTTDSRTDTVRVEDIISVSILSKTTKKDSSIVRMAIARTITMVRKVIRRIISHVKAMVSRAMVNKATTIMEDTSSVVATTSSVVVIISVVLAISSVAISVHTHLDIILMQNTVLRSA